MGFTRRDRQTGRQADMYSHTQTRDQSEDIKGPALQDLTRKLCSQLSWIILAGPTYPSPFCLPYSSSMTQNTLRWMLSAITLDSKCKKFLLTALLAPFLSAFQHHSIPVFLLQKSANSKASQTFGGRSLSYNYLPTSAS